MESQKKIDKSYLENNSIIAYDIFVLASSRHNGLNYLFYKNDPVLLEN